MRLAAIDLGTNTVHLLVADAGPSAWRLVHHDQIVTRLGEGLWPAGVLQETPMARTEDVVATYVDRARGLGATRVRIVATSAVREAANGEAFARRLAARTASHVEVVSGAEEARLTLRGVLDGLGRPRGALLVFDIGGGSTEFTVARDDALATTVSLRLGVVRLNERFPFPDTVEPERYRAMARTVAAQLARELPREIAGATFAELVGTAGTVTALAALDLGLPRYDSARVQGHRLTRAAVEHQLARLSALTLEARGRVACLEPGRADIVIPGIAIVLATMAQVGTETLVVSDAGLREGIVADTAGRLGLS
jgi:exopolyphosphatase/guanosine-5'-triphosphate,3'-diphosphate pyrophosphatase